MTAQDSRRYHDLRREAAEAGTAPRHRAPDARQQEEADEERPEGEATPPPPQAPPPAPPPLDVGDPCSSFLSIAPEEDMARDPSGDATPLELPGCTASQASGCAELWPESWSLPGTEPRHAGVESEDVVWAGDRSSVSSEYYADEPQDAHRRHLGVMDPSGLLS